MGRNILVDGDWRTDIEPYTDESGAFDRAETSFRVWIQDAPDSKFQPAAGRYHLYIARNCPWAHGAALTRRLAGLTDIVSMDIVTDSTSTSTTTSGRICGTSTRRQGSPRRCGWNTSKMTATTKGRSHRLGRGSITTKPTTAINFQVPTKPRPDRRSPDSSRISNAYRLAAIAPGSPNDIARLPLSLSGALCY